jgi:hypothetical protein
VATATGEAALTHRHIQSRLSIPALRTYKQAPCLDIAQQTTTHSPYPNTTPQPKILTTDNKAFHNKKKHCSLKNMPTTYFRQYHYKLINLSRDYMQLPSITATSSLTLPHSFFANKLTLPLHCLPITTPDHTNTVCNPCRQTPHIPSLINGNYQLHVHSQIHPFPETKKKK